MVLNNTEQREVIALFIAGKQDGVCPMCGAFAEAYDSDEGPGYNHFLERYYTCECGCEFTEKFDCVPISLTIDKGF